MNLDRLKGDFDRVRLLDYDALCELSAAFAPGNDPDGHDPDGHWLLWEKAHPTLGTGWVISTIPDPEAFDEDEWLYDYTLKVAEAEYAQKVSDYERG